MEVAAQDIAIITLLVISAIGIATLSLRVPYPIVAATDPIAVLAIFKQLGAPHELAVLIEGESLLNDGTAVVLSRILLGGAGRHVQGNRLAGPVCIGDGRRAGEQIEAELEHMYQDQLAFEAEELRSTQ
jgi:hypothetical protein